MAGKQKVAKTGHVKIVSHGATAEILIDGKDVAPYCSKYILEHNGGDICRLVLICRNVEFEGEEVEIVNGSKR